MKPSAARTPSWLPTLCGVIAAGLAAIAGVLVLGSTDHGSGESRTHAPAMQVDSLPLPPPIEPEDTAAGSNSVARSSGSASETSAIPRPAMPQFEMPPLELSNDAIVGLPVPAHLGDLLDWEPTGVTWPRGTTGIGADGLDTAVAESGNQSATRWYTPDLSDHYPRRARLRDIEGRTTVRLTVDASGTVENIEIVSSEPAGIFESAARRAAKRLRYEPAKREGVAVASTVEATFVWTLE